MLSTQGDGLSCIDTVGDKPRRYLTGARCPEVTQDRGNLIGALQNCAQRVPHFVRSDIDEVLLLPFQLHCLFHLSLLEALGPLLGADVGNASKDALEHTIFVFLGKRGEQDPGITFISVAVLPRSLEAEFYVDCSSVFNQTLSTLR